MALSQNARSSMYGTGVVSDFIPFCLWVLSAGGGSVGLNRAVSSMEVLNKYEKVAFDHHVGNSPSSRSHLCQGRWR